MSEHTNERWQKTYTDEEVRAIYEREKRNVDEEELLRRYSHLETGVPFEQIIAEMEEIDRGGKEKAG